MFGRSQPKLKMTMMTIKIWKSSFCITNLTANEGAFVALRCVERCKCKMCAMFGLLKIFNEINNLRVIAFYNGR